MAEYNVDIQVRAKTREAESQITRLQKTLDDLSKKTANINFGSVERSVRDIGTVAKNVGNEVKGIFSRGLFAGAILGAGQLSTSITDVISKFSFLGKGVAGSLNNALGGVPEVVGNILNQIGHIPNAMGLAAVAAMAFAPQLLKASSAAAGLGAAVDKAVGKQVTQNIAGTIGQINGLNMAVDNVKTSFEELIKGSTLNQLNSQLKDARYQIGEYHSSTEKAVTAAAQLVTVLRAQKAEQQAINDLVRSAQGLRSESTERRATNTYNVIQRRKKLLEEQAIATTQATQATRDLEQAESTAARNRLAAAAKAKADALREQALATQQAFTSLQTLEQAESNAARGRLATAAKARDERAAFLAGGQVSQFPFGPNPRSTRRGFEGDVSADRAENALRARELRQQRAENLRFFDQEKLQLAEIDRLRDATSKRQIARIQSISKAIRGSLSSAAIGGAFPLLFGQSPQAAVGGAIGGLLGGQAGGFAGSLIGTALGEIEAAKARTKELAAELGFSSAQAKQLATAFELAGRNSQQLESAIINIQGLGLSTNETASAIKIAIELSKEYGGSVDKIAQAFADTLESGKVSISTLNKFTAQGIPIQEQLATKLGVNRTKLLEMAKDGRISVQQVTDALVEMGRQAENTVDKGATGFDRFTKSVSAIATAIAGAAGALLKNLVPALDAVLGKLAAVITRATQAINLITDATVGETMSAVFKSGFARGTGTVSKSAIDEITKGLGTLNPLAAATAEQLDKIDKAVRSAQAELGRYGGDLGEYSVKTAQVQLSRVQKAILTRRGQLGAPSAVAAAIPDINAPVNLPPSGGGSSAESAAERAAKAAAKEAERVAKIIRDRTAETEVMRLQSTIQDRITEAEIARDPMLVARLEGQQRILDLQVKYATELANETDLKAQQAIITEGQVALAAAQRNTERELAEIARSEGQRRLDDMQKYIEQQYELNVAVQQQKDLADSITTTLNQGLVSTFDLLIQGSQNWQQSLQQIASGVLVDIANQLLRIFVIEQALNSIRMFLTPFNPATPIGTGGGTVGRYGTLGPNYGIRQRANGGPVSAGSPYIVGERGPELFMPRSSGSIYPNHAMGMGGANVVVNVDASGTNVEGNPGQGKALGAVIGAAVQAELIKQKKPGGLLY